MAPKKPAAAAVPEPVAAEPAAPVDPGPETDKKKIKVRAAFRIFDPDNTGNIVAAEVPTLMRYLNLFVSDADWENTLLPDLQLNEPAPYISLNKVEAKLIGLMDVHMYEPDRPETLFAAFRAMDKDNKGYVELPKLREALMTGPTPIPSEELDALCRVLAPKASSEEAKENPELQRVYYADYIAMMTRFR